VGLDLPQDLLHPRRPPDVGHQRRANIVGDVAPHRPRRIEIGSAAGSGRRRVLLVSVIVSVVLDAGLWRRASALERLGLGSAVRLLDQRLPARAGRAAAPPNPCCATALQAGPYRLSAVDLFERQDGCLEVADQEA
jgi:hypothetical protein